MRINRVNKVDTEDVKGVQIPFILIGLKGQAIYLRSKNYDNWYHSGDPSTQKFLWLSKSDIGKGLNIFIGRSAFSFNLS